MPLYALIIVYTAYYAQIAHFENVSKRRDISFRYGLLLISIDAKQVSFDANLLVMDI